MERLLKVNLRGQQNDKEEYSGLQSLHLRFIHMLWNSFNLKQTLPPPQKQF